MQCFGVVYREITPGGGGGGAGGGTPRNSWWGCAAVLQILTLFQTKTCYFPYPFSDLASKIHSRFQTWSLKSIPVFRPDIYVYKGLNYITIA